MNFHQHGHQELDFAVLDLLRSGNEKAFKIVFDKYHRYLYVVAYRYLMSQDAAEDAVQYTFVRLWEKRENFDYKAGIKNLLFTILKHYVLNEIKHNNTVLQKHYEISQNISIAADDLTEYIDKKDKRAYIYKKIKELPVQKRIICMLKIQKGLSNEEIANTMKISVNTVKSHYNSALKTLKISLKELQLILFIYFFV